MEDVYCVVADTLGFVCRGVADKASVIDSRGQSYLSSESNTRIMRQHLPTSPLASMSSVLAGILVEYVAPQAEELLSSIYSSDCGPLQCMCRDIFLQAGILHTPTEPEASPPIPSSGDSTENIPTTESGAVMNEEPAETENNASSDSATADMVEGDAT